ncbi:Acid stress protein IbaG [Candidatus Erwinia haradaeae]|uniref:Acid stress protein IbaG n=1 Tax=Candidatus Erwinia haradaeae TaxID=1922217 RepID=A0A451DJD1_9GAMM|nr:BolA family protein [Candidatus Erwinia haradaeae]VFP86775.1 Acid stress protein IbaG [Candidatus Erwinia haradaeae]
MVDKSIIKSALLKILPLQEVYISGDDNHLQIIAIGQIFNGLSRVQKQKIVYAPLISYITDNHVHAVSIKTFTPEEWHRDAKLNDY